MLTDERIWELWRESEQVHSMEVDMAFARAIEQEAVRQERERCATMVEARAGMRGTGAWVALTAAADAIRARSASGDQVPAGDTSR